MGFGCSLHHWPIPALVNGLAQSDSGVYLRDVYLSVSGAQITDTMFFDVFSGAKTVLYSQPYVVAYTGQDVYLNGLNLITGRDFVMSGTHSCLQARTLASSAAP